MFRHHKKETLKKYHYDHLDPDWIPNKKKYLENMIRIDAELLQERGLVLKPIGMLQLKEKLIVTGSHNNLGGTASVAEQLNCTGMLQFNEEV